MNPYTSAFKNTLYFSLLLSFFIVFEFYRHNKIRLTIDNVNLIGISIDRADFFKSTNNKLFAINKFYIFARPKIRSYIVNVK